MSRILIVDDDLSLREVLEIALVGRGHEIRTARDSGAAWDVLVEEQVDLVLLDLRLGRENGLDLLGRIRGVWPDIPVLMITAFADSKSAVQAMKLGARDYISKPFELHDLLQAVDRTLDRPPDPASHAHGQGRHGKILGRSREMVRVFDLIDRIAPTRINVLLTGESGTGKELVARAIHEASARARKPFVAINCGGLPENLVESELFGFRKGAFTGADRNKKGLLEVARGGTVFLDEVAELEPATQVKLLRCVQERRFIPLGGSEEVDVDIRFLAATNRPLESDIRDGLFREDLFYRLSGVIIHLPPLRDRQEDILLLAEHFLAGAAAEQGRKMIGFTPKARSLLQKYEYPGNVRELENIIDRAVALEGGTSVHSGSLIMYGADFGRTRPDAASGHVEAILQGEMTLDDYLRRQELAVLQAALERTGGHKGNAAALVGLNFRQFRYRLSKVEDGSAGDKS